ncbi:unnamed protein product [Paramecium sonneborni]|uniref:Uncharacterized protein n=1 Tax=Paramecium sonneborni TaxID=65129 RepID=A0A8S1RUP0_9CILI|nr:unnamed protein product [Paramecium sonneborni]
MCKCFECATYVHTCKKQCYCGINIRKEECDDEFQRIIIQLYGNCKNCKIFCRPDCQQCDYTKGICLYCREVLMLNQNYYINICGDGILVNVPGLPFNDGNAIEFDGFSHKCQFQCQNSKICEFYHEYKCKLCQYGYHLNMMMNQGQCDSSYLDCDLSEEKGCIKCKIGYELRNKICYPICGDSIISYHEQCDDGNMNIEDGCHQCQYTCEFTCKQCLLEYCMICDDGYEMQFGRCQIHYIYQKLDKQRISIHKFNHFNIFYKIFINSVSKDQNVQNKKDIIMVINLINVILNVEIILTQEKNYVTMEMRYFKMDFINANFHLNNYITHVFKELNLSKLLTWIQITKFNLCQCLWRWINVPFQIV